MVRGSAKATQRARQTTHQKPIRPGFTLPRSASFSACIAKAIGAQPGPTSTTIETITIVARAVGPSACAPSRPQAIAPGMIHVPI